MANNELKKSTIIWEGQDKPKAKKEKHYVDNKEFYKALVERKEKVDENLANNLPPPPISEYIGHCILKIAENLAKKHQFYNYKFKDEMISDAILSCIKGIDKFNTVEYNNPFAYFTQTCFFAFISRITSEQKQTYIKCKTTQDALTSGALADDSESGNGSKILDNMDFPQDYMEGFIKDYEEKNKIKKKKQQKNQSTLERFYT